MKKNIICGVIIIVAIVCVFGYLIMNNVSTADLIGSSGDNATKMLSSSKGGVMVQYPSEWVLSESTSNSSVIALAKSDSIDSSKVGQVTINVEKQPIGGSFDSFINKTYTAMQHDSSFNLTSSGQVLINDKNATEYVYTSDVDGVVKEHKAIWFDKGDQAYVVLYSAPIDKFNENLNSFNYILENMQILFIFFRGIFMIILCVTGSIAATESIKLARELKRNDVEVKCFMSEAACDIITPNAMEFATGNEVVTRLTGKIEHVKYSQEDLILVAPATANTISKFAYKLADDPISTLLITAYGHDTPILFVPSMHDSMFKAIKDNIDKIKEEGSASFIKPKMDEGKAKFPDKEDIVLEALRTINLNK